MTDYNTMTAQDCADWLAERDGWTWRPYADSDNVRLWSHPDKLDMLEYRGIVGCDNGGPYKLTLDAAADALREGWRVDYIRDRGEYAGLGDARWFIRVFRVPGDITNSVCCEGPDRLTAEYRAAVAARMEDK